MSDSAFCSDDYCHISKRLSTHSLYRCSRTPYTQHDFSFTFFMIENILVLLTFWWMFPQRESFSEIARFILEFSRGIRNEIAFLSREISTNESKRVSFDGECVRCICCLKPVWPPYCCSVCLLFYTRAAILVFFFFCSNQCDGKHATDRGGEKWNAADCNTYLLSICSDSGRTINVQ